MYNTADTIYIHTYIHVSAMDDILAGKSDKKFIETDKQVGVCVRLGLGHISLLYV